MTDINYGYYKFIIYNFQIPQTFGYKIRNKFNFPMFLLNFI